MFEVKLYIDVGDENLAEFVVDEIESEQEAMNTILTACSGGTWQGWGESHGVITYFPPHSIVYAEYVRVMESSTATQEKIQ